MACLFYVSNIVEPKEKGGQPEGCRPFLRTVLYAREYKIECSDYFWAI